MEVNRQCIWCYAFFIAKRGEHLCCTSNCRNTFNYFTGNELNTADRIIWLSSYVATGKHPAPNHLLTNKGEHNNI